MDPAGPHDAPTVMSRSELTRVFAAVEPRVLRRLLATYSKPLVTPSRDDAGVHEALVEDYLYQGGLGASFLAELAVLAPQHAEQVRREAELRDQTVSRIKVSGPQPLLARTERDGGLLSFWITPVILRDPDLRPYRFLVVALAALEGGRGRDDDPPELLAGAATSVELDGGARSAELAALDRALSLAVFVAPANLSCESYDLDAAADLDCAPGAPVIGWIATDVGLRWCHLELGRWTCPVSVVPALADDGLVVARGQETVAFVGEQLVRLVCERGPVRLAEARRVVARAILTVAPLRDRVRWALRWALAQRTGGAAVGGAAAPPSRLLDWLYDDQPAVSTALRSEFLGLLAVVQAAAAIVYLVTAFELGRVIAPEYGDDELAQQLRSGLGAVLIVGALVPTLYSVRVGMLCAWMAAFAATVAFAISAATETPFTTAVIAAACGAMLGTVAATLTLEVGPQPHAGRLDVVRTIKLALGVALACAVCSAGFLLTRWEVFRERPLPIALAIGLLLLLLLGRVLARLHRRSGRSWRRSLFWLYLVGSLPLTALIWLGIAWATDPYLSGLLEGAALAGLACVLLFAFSPALRVASVRTARVFWLLLFPAALAGVLWLLSPLAPGLQGGRLAIAVEAFAAASLVSFISIAPNVGVAQKKGRSS